MDTLKSLVSKRSNQWIIAGVVVAALLIVLAVSGNGGAFLSGLAGVTCDTAELQTIPNIGFIVAPSGLNVRTGPGENYGFANSGQQGLPVCTKFSLVGRNNESTWLYITTPKMTGWIKYDAQWESVNVNIGDLPISNAIGTPSLGTGSSGSSSGGYGGPIADDYISIGGGKISSGKIVGLPANKTCVVALFPAGQAGKAVTIWQGTTSNDGALGFQANFPTTWSDGSAVKYGTLTIAFYVNGEIQRSWNLTYGQ